ncbi:MAG TPA: alpha-L-arabinofuranosidase C-terminal domain-containing protein, partial [Fimbriimonadaceae bacterium]|nr:alpha-L-arabinofuranosidase C-terminal domain-containing protein [Fimbriimonadaceae bacterium]
AEMVDDHYYNSPSWFWRNAGIYDRAPRTGPKVYVGEYAVTSNCGKGNLRAALAEAAFMTGLERNSDLVEMASYAPLFVNVNNRAWNPDAICFDGEHSYGTPSYYVQSLFGANRGDTFLPSDFPTLPVDESFTGGVGLGTWETSAEYKDVAVEQDGKVLYASDFKDKAGDWRPATGDWSVSDGTYRQSADAQNARSYLNLPELARLGDCTVRLKARKLGGVEGFLVLFHAQDRRRFLWWNIGGWGNQECGVEASSGGGKYSIGRHVPFKVETGKWYDIRIECRGPEMQLFIDDKLVQTVRVTGMPTLAVSASRIDASGDLILKVVNGGEADRQTMVQLAGIPDGAFEATVATLASGSQDDENSLAEPTKVSPKLTRTTFAHSKFDLTLPARSLTVLRLHRK